MSLNLSIKQKGLLLVLVPVGSMMVFVLLLYLLLASEIERYKVFQGDRRLTYALQRAHSATARAVFVFSYSAREADTRLHEVEKIERQILSERDWEKVDDNFPISPELRTIAKQGSVLRKSTLALIAELKDAATNKPGTDRTYQMAFTVLPAGAEVAEFYDKLLDLRSRLARETAEKAQERALFIALVVIGSMGCVLLAGVAVWLFSREIVERLNATARTMQLIALGKTVTTPAARSDELGALEREVLVAAVRLNEAKARESAVLNGASHLILSLDSRMRITVVGESCRKLWLYDSDELIGNSILNFVAKDLFDETKAAFDTAAREGQGDIETQVVLSDGTRRDTLWTVNWSEKQQSFYCVVRDVTEMRRVERLRQYFLSMAGHDLRSPLTAIGMNLSMIMQGARGPVPERLQNELSTMEAYLNGLVNFVNQLLDLEKLEASKGALNLTPVSASDVCESAIERLEGECRSKEVRLLNPAGAALVHADEEKFEKAVFSLIGSAVKLAPLRAVLALSVSRSDGTGKVTVSVPGLILSPDVSEGMFDKLRMTAVQTADGENIGLGLAVVKAVADAHDGTVGFECAGGTTSFWLAVPLCEDDMSA